METPICDFAEAYRASETARFHMPGHKGAAFLGCEPWDLTEIQGADSLYEAEGIIAASERNASRLFGSGRTFYSVEGSSQCIRAMLYLALTCRPAGSAPLILAARNVHKAFVYGAALLDLQVQWLWPEGGYRSVCGCPVTPETLENRLSALKVLPAAVYVTSPDYLGAEADLRGLAQVCHRHGTRLLVDNAHGAYLRFLKPSRHPMDLGADLCCDSAHKTLPVLTGGAYLHLSSRLPEEMCARGKQALALFGSTSPSYLILASLDRCNRYLAEQYDPMPFCARLENLRKRLRTLGWHVEPSDPMRITITAPAGLTGTELADRLRRSRIECEYADPESLVLMLTPENRAAELQRLPAALGPCPGTPPEGQQLPPAKGEQAVSIRQALLSPHETVPAREALGRICGAPTVACPPAIPIAVSGERIGPEALTLFAHYGVETVDVLK